jgi:hypothetical protein
MPKASLTARNASPQAALRLQHATQERDTAVADALPPTRTGRP